MRLVIVEPDRRPVNLMNSALLSSDEKLERYGRGWAGTFPEDIVMLVEEDA